MILTIENVKDKTFLKDEFKDTSFKDEEGNSFELFYEVSTYFSPMDFEYKIKVAVREKYENINQLSMSEIELIKHDDTNILAGYFLTCLFEMSDELLKTILDDNQELFKISFACAYIIMNNKLNLVKSENKIALNNLIYIADIQKIMNMYSEIDFTEIFKQSENYKHPMYINNLIRNTIKLIENDIINSENVRENIVRFYSNKEYYYDSDIELILSLSRKDEQFISNLMEFDFHLDIFIEQTNFGYWLKEFEKYKMFEKLLLALTNSEISKKFNAKYESHRDLIEWHKKICT